VQEKKGKEKKMMQRKKNAEHCQKGTNYINPVFTRVKTRSPQSFH